MIAQQQYRVSWLGGPTHCVVTLIEEGKEWMGWEADRTGRAREKCQASDGGEKIKKTQAALGIAEVKITNLEKLQGTYKSVPGISTDVGGLKERMDVVVGGRIEEGEKLGDRMSDLEKLMRR